ncbi:MAG: hypothetical protein JOZ56_08055 [Actinobacteria bacterium]|nr:hypothetical protein [Actinomycetota bacterium]MBV8563027.1 hypothetical protein [Actinomycetota bacterium]
MRVALLALGISALVLASTASARDPKEPQQRHTAADTKLAQSIALGRTDLPKGWRVQPPRAQTPPCTTEPNESELTQTARIDPTFLWSDGLTSVGSEVDVFKTAAQATTDWRLSTLALMRTCLLEAANRQLAPQHIGVRLVSATELPAPKLGERALHYRLVLALTGAKQKTSVPIVTELIGIGVGRVSVVLHALARGNAIPGAGMNALAALLAKRLVAASGGI